MRAVQLCRVSACALCLMITTGCGVQPAAVPTETPAPTVTFEDASWQDFPIQVFDSVHSPVNGDANEHLIFGALPISPPGDGLAPELAAFLGRWEGYDYSPPVKRDNKGVFVISEITPQGGTAFLWAGTNLQYPYWVKQIQFRVVPGDVPFIEWEGDLAGFPADVSGSGTFRFAYDSQTHSLVGGINMPPESLLNGPTVFTQSQTFYVYEDYAGYLRGKGITAESFENRALERYGAGYLLSLPDGYDDNPEQVWPLIFFLHGYGDRGDNLFVLAKASPFMYIREEGDLPAIIVAPLLQATDDLNAFPEDYMNGVLEEIRANYRVDPARIALTGLSMGAESAYRFALDRPDVFAALATLSGYLDAEALPQLERIVDVPVWVIHGEDDTVIPLSIGRLPADTLEALGGDVRFTVLADHDHDVWTDTYSDPAFYDWLLAQHR